MRLLLPLGGERTEQHVQSRVAVRRVRSGASGSAVHTTKSNPPPRPTSPRPWHLSNGCVWPFSGEKHARPPRPQASGRPARRLGSRPAGRRRRQPSQDTALAATIGHKQVGDKHHHYHCEDEREVDVLDGYAQHI